MNKELKICSSVLFSSVLFLISIYLIRKGYITGLILTGNNEINLTNLFAFLFAFLFVTITMMLIIYMGVKIGVNWMEDVPISEKILYIIIYLFLGLIEPLILLYEGSKAFVGEYALITLLLMIGATIYFSHKSTKDVSSK